MQGELLPFDGARDVRRIDWRASLFHGFEMAAQFRGAHGLEQGASNREAGGGAELPCRVQHALCLATSLPQASAKTLMSLYGKRWSIECGLRDAKDLRFGMGTGSIHVSSPERRDRLWLLNAFAIALLTLLGAAGEAIGYHRYLKSNTSKRCTHSLFRQGCMLYELVPTMPDERLTPLIVRFAAMLAEIPSFANTFEAI